MTTDPIVPDPPLLALIIKHEGSVATPYLDSRGILTVACGHNLVAHPLPGETYPMSPERIQAVLADDLNNVVVALGTALPWLQQLDEVRQAVLIDMGFNMGVLGLLRWPNTLKAVQGGKWQIAADGMLGSLWAKQVGIRAQEDATMMLTGAWPDGLC